MVAIVVRIALLVNDCSRNLTSTDCHSFVSDATQLSRVVFYQALSARDNPNHKLDSHFSYRSLVLVNQVR